MIKLANLQTPKTLYLAVYESDTNECAITGSLRKVDGTLEDDVLALTAPTHWQALADALADAEVIEAQHIIVFTNSPALLKWYVAPEPDSTTPVWEVKGKGKGNGRYEDYPVGGNPHHWAVMRGLVRYWCRGGSYQVVEVDGSKLTKAQAIIQP